MAQFQSDRVITLTLCTYEPLHHFMSDAKKSIVKEDPKDKAIVDVSAQKMHETESKKQETRKQKAVNKKQKAKGKKQETEKNVAETQTSKADKEKSDPIDQASEDMKTSTDKDKKSGKWFVVHTYSGHENKAAEALKQRVAAMNLSARIFETVVPTRNIVVVRHGKKDQTKEKIFPGYILVHMILDDETWLAVRTTPGVTAFVGMGNKPTPISEKEVAAIMKFMKMEAPTFKTKFSVGEAVKIVDGPFADFLGSVESIDEAKGKVKVLVSIFGRETPVELDFLQIMKL